MTTDSLPIRVLLVDDHRTTLWGLAELIGEEVPRLSLAGMATNRAEALRLAHAKQPNVILLDIDLGCDNGFDLIPELRLACAAHIVILTGLSTPGLRRRAASLGASGFVHKEDAAERIIAAIERAA